MVQAEDGDLYGTTVGGGGASSCFPDGCGTVFKITPSGMLTTLHIFSNQDGVFPYAGLIQAADGNFYGTTFEGGVNGLGTVFKITPSGMLTTIYNFCSQVNCADGSFPFASLLQASDGNFYGTTSEGGTPGACVPGGNMGCGTVFRITPGGTLTTLHAFHLTDGAGPRAGLVQGLDGNLYGTAVYGGLFGSCYGGPGCGTVFKITLGGKLTTLHRFDPTSGGAGPSAALTEATDGSFYGSYDGGGIIFKITPDGALTTVYSSTGSGGALLQATNGSFYGTTYFAGTSGDGSVFGLAVGLGPFVETQPSASRAGGAVKILGTNLTGATSVSFNGTAAMFTVVARSLITTTVPAGATTGKIQVVTPSGTLSSNVPFRVVQ